MRLLALALAAFLLQPPATGIRLIVKGDDMGAAHGINVGTIKAYKDGIDHGSTNDPEMQAIGHRGYEYVAADRSANVEMWTSPKVREVITRRKIKLTNYRELTKK